MCELVSSKKHVSYTFVWKMLGLIFYTCTYGCILVNVLGTNLYYHLSTCGRPGNQFVDVVRIPLRSKNCYIQIFGLKTSNLVELYSVNS